MTSYCALLFTAVQWPIVEHFVHTKWCSHALHLFNYPLWSIMFAFIGVGMPFTAASVSSSSSPLPSPIPSSSTCMPCFHHVLHWCHAHEYWKAAFWSERHYWKQCKQKMTGWGKASQLVFPQCLPMPLFSRCTKRLPISGSLSVCLPRYATIFNV